MKEKCDLIASLKEELEKVQEAERQEKAVSTNLIERENLIDREQTTLFHSKYILLYIMI